MSSAGDRRDYKFWADPAMMGLMPMASKVEVCYCDDNCDNSFNFFKADSCKLDAVMP